MIPMIMSRRADVDADEITLYLLRQNAIQAADRFGPAVDETVEFLAQFPDIGDSRPEILGEASTVRVFPVRGFENYLIYFRRSAHRAVVLRVLHAARNIDPTIFPELPT